MEICGAIFDVDGTILDSMEIWENCANVYLKSKGIEAENLSDALFSYTIEMSASYLKKRFLIDDSEEKIVADIIQIIRDFYFNKVQLRCGVLEVLESFKKKNIPIVVASSGERELIDAAFSRLDIRGFFKEIITGTKNTVDVFLSALEILGTQAENTVVFEDAIYAAETAKKVGFKVCGINEPHSRQNQEELKKICDIYIADWSEFKIS